MYNDFIIYVAWRRYRYENFQSKWIEIRRLQDLLSQFYFKNVEVRISLVIICSRNLASIAWGCVRNSVTVWSVESGRKLPRGSFKL